MADSKPIRGYRVQVKGGSGAWPEPITIYADTAQHQRGAKVDTLTFKLKGETVGFFDQIAGWWIWDYSEGS